MPIRRRKAALHSFAVVGTGAAFASALLLLYACADKPTVAPDQTSQLRRHLISQPMAGDPGSMASLTTTRLTAALTATGFTADPFAADFVVTGSESGEGGEHYFPSNGDGTFGGRSNIPGLGSVDGLDVADMDGDGDNDFLACDGSTGDVYRYVNGGLGSFVPSLVASDVSSAGFCTNLRVADFNEDGRNDFVVGDEDFTKGIYVYLQNASGGFTKSASGLDVSWTASSDAFFGIAAGDVDGDGHQDIVVLGYVGTEPANGDVRLYRGDGAGGMTSSTSLFDVGTDFGDISTTGLALFDVDSDGDLDIVVGGGFVDATAGNHYVYTNNGSGSFTKPAAAAFSIGGQSGVDASDVDGDGDHDLLVAAFGPNKLYLVTNNGGTLAAPALVGDLDGASIGVGAPPINAATRPSAPSITGITSGDQQVSVDFTPPDNDGGAAITNYEYSTNDGETWTARDPDATTSPIVITGLTNGTTYNVKIRAVNSAGAGDASNTVPATPAAEGDAARSEPVPAGEAATVTASENGKDIAGVDIPQGALTEDANVTVRLERLEAGERCHSYLMKQQPICVEITAKNAQNQDVAINGTLLVGFCVPPTALHESLYSFERENGVDGPPEPLHQRNAPFLNCDGFQTASVRPKNWLQGLAMGLSRRVGKWITPKSAYAADDGFGGDVTHLSFFTWAAPIVVTNAGLAPNAFNSGKDAFGVTGVFGPEAKGFNPFADEAGFIAAPGAETLAYDVTVTYGTYVETIPGSSFKYNKRIKRYAFVSSASVGINYMDFDSSTGEFRLAGRTGLQGALPSNRGFTIQVGHRIRGGMFVCGTNGSCVLQQ